MDIIIIILFHFMLITIFTGYHILIIKTKKLSIKLETDHVKEILSYGCSLEEIRRVNPVLLSYIQYIDKKF